MININKRITALICAIALLLASLGGTLYYTYFSYSAEEEDYSGLQGGVWTGFASCESSGEGGRQAAGDSGHAYGIFQFDDRYDLWNFIGKCMDYDYEKYGMFQELYDKYSDSSALISGSSADTATMTQLWHNAYDADPEGFTQLQFEEFLDVYYAPLVPYCNKKGIDIEDESKYSPVIRGTLWSISIWDYLDGAEEIIDKFSPSMTEEEMLDICYSLDTAGLKGTNSKYYQSFVNRWTVDQKSLAAQAYSQWKAGIEIPTTESDNILAGLKGSGFIYGIDGGNYIDYVKEWIDKYPDLSQAFKDSGGWNSENKEWCISIRTAGDFYEMYGIIGGGEYIDFTGYTSSGMWVDGYVNVNAENYHIPDNGSSMPIVYFTQGSGAEWGSLAFGGGTIASSGCSITSISMCLSYLLGGTDSSEWVYPSDVRQMIINKTGDYNYFYDKVNGSGQKWSIFDSVPQWFGVNCSSISSGSIKSAIAAGHPVIMRCGAGEFTNSGHFIVITGCDSEGYYYVNDPNGAHSDKSYKKYALSYLISQGTAWWELYN